MDVFGTINGGVAFFKAASDVLTAGLALTTFSLFLYSLTFRIQDRLTTIFSAILFALILVFGADAFGSVITEPDILMNIIKVHWVGLLFIPTLYFHFSDALLEMTGKPSKGKRKYLGYIFILVSFALLFFLFRGDLLGELVLNEAPAPFFYRTTVMNLYLIFFFITIGLSIYNFYRAVKRTNTRTSKRRMLYLVFGALGLLFGLFPYLTFESSIGVFSTLTFWLTSSILYLTSWILLLTMTYAISFFGFSVPDREIKKRLMHWIFRGPLTASIALGLTTLIRRAATILGQDLTMLEILAMVASVVLLQHTYTLLFPKMEKILFTGKDLQELERVRRLEERLFTKHDFEQFSEIILANICDRIRVTDAVIMLKLNGSFERIVAVGEEAAILAAIQEMGDDLPNYENDKLLYPKGSINLILLPSISVENDPQVIPGYIAVKDLDAIELDDEQTRAVNVLLTRLRTAILDYLQQQKMLLSLDILAPQIDEMQYLLAAGRFNPLGTSTELNNKDQVNKWTKDALSHLWGGPKLSNNALLQLNVVQERAGEMGITLTKALSSILKDLIRSLQPEGERQYTNEWLLYNILDFKFNQNMKMRDIAKRLSLSEADLYRKQRVAVDLIAAKIINLENSSSEE